MVCHLGLRINLTQSFIGKTGEMTNHSKIFYHIGFIWLPKTAHGGGAVHRPTVPQNRCLQSSLYSLFLQNFRALFFFSWFWFWLFTFVCQSKISVMKALSLSTSPYVYCSMNQTPHIVINCQEPASAEARNKLFGETKCGIQMDAAPSEYLRMLNPPIIEAPANPVAKK
jgi:hypothetical protein